MPWISKKPDLKNDPRYLEPKINENASLLAQIADLECDLSAHGILPDSDVDYTEQIKTLIPQYKRFVIKGGKYKISSQLLLKHGQVIRTIGKVTLEGTNFTGQSGDAILKVTNEGNKYTQLPNLASNVLKGQLELTFGSAHGLQVGDVVCLYDNTPNSYSSARTYYKKGEFARVMTIVSDTSILLDSPIFSDYTSLDNSNFGVYKMNMGTFTIDGSIEVIQNKPGNFSGFVLERVKDSVFKNVSAYANNGSTRACVLDQCINVRIDGTFIQQLDSGLGVDYGLAIVNCQNIFGDIYASSTQHAITTGGYDGVGAIINRVINLKGNVKSTDNSYAIGLHGNTEYFSFEGLILGGIMAAGNFSRFNGTVTNASTGISIIMYEASGFDHDFSGMTIISNKNPSPNGVVDFSGTGTADTANMRGGTFNLSNATIEAKSAAYGIVMRMRNTVVDTTQKRFLNLSGIVCELRETDVALGYRITDETDLKPYDFVNLQGFVSNGGTPILTDVLDSIHTKKFGRDEIQLSTTVKYVAKAIKFPVAFPLGYTPAVIVNMNASASGGFIKADVYAVDNTGFSIRVSSLDGANFTANNITGFSWSAL